MSTEAELNKAAEEAEAKAKADEEAKAAAASSENNTNDDDSDDSDDEEDAPKKTVSSKAFYSVKTELKEAKRALRDIQRLEEDRKNAELPELDRLKKENQTYQDRLGKLESEQAKHDAYNRLKKMALGDNYTLENEDKVLAQVRKLVYDEDSLDDDIADLLDIAKRPKKGGSQTLNLGEANKGRSDKKPEEYTAKELKELEKSDPDRFKEVISLRRSSRR